MRPDLSFSRERALININLTAAPEKKRHSPPRAASRPQNAQRTRHHGNNSRGVFSPACSRTATPSTHTRVAREKLQSSSRRRQRPTQLRREFRARGGLIYLARGERSAAVHALLREKLAVARPSFAAFSFSRRLFAARRCSAAATIELCPSVTCARTQHRLGGIRRSVHRCFAPRSLGFLFESECCGFASAHKKVELIGCRAL